MSFTVHITRHLFSCANLKKSKKDSKGQVREQDPSLTLYGILSSEHLRLPDSSRFPTTVYVSTLVRTWQTAILLYTKQFNDQNDSQRKLNLKIVPYIQEESSLSFLPFSVSVDNVPYSFDKQREVMLSFMNNLGLMFDEAYMKMFKRTTYVIEYLYDDSKKFEISWSVDGFKISWNVYDSVKKVNDKQEKLEPYKNSLSEYISYIREEQKRVIDTKPVKDTTLKENSKIDEREIDTSINSYKESPNIHSFIRGVIPKEEKEKYYVVSHSSTMTTFLKGVLTNFKKIEENGWRMTLTLTHYTVEDVVVHSGFPTPSLGILDKIHSACEPNCDFGNGNSVQSKRPQERRDKCSVLILKDRRPTGKISGKIMGFLQPWGTNKSHQFTTQEGAHITTDEFDLKENSVSAETVSLTDDLKNDVKIKREDANHWGLSTGGRRRSRRRSRRKSGKSTAK